jgi:hypothetical protein
MRERVRHSRANLLLLRPSLKEFVQSFFCFMRAFVSLSLSARVLMSAKENAAFRRSLFSLLSAGVRLLRVERERERERDGKFSRSVALLVEKEFGDLVLRAPDKDTERERESDRFDERVDQKRRA